MANVQHSALTGSDLHEPKGVAAANAGEVYEADGAGSGDWVSRVQRGTLQGLGLSNNSTDSDHDIDIAEGVCRAADDSASIQNTATKVKRIDASWVTGTNQGGLSSSLTLSNNTWYHVHAIKVAGVDDFGFDTSVTAANLVTDHSATAYRRIGSVRTDGSGNIISFLQYGDIFVWNDQIMDIEDASPNSNSTGEVRSPPDVRCLVQVVMRQTSGNNTRVYTPGTDTASPQSDAVPLVMDDGGGSVAQVLTDTSSQIGYRSSGGNTVYISLTHYTDFRGKFD